MSSLLKNLVIALVIAVVVWLGYTYFIKKDDGPSTLDTGLSSTAALEAQEFLVKLNELNTLRVEGTIFGDPRFNSLIDFRQQIPPEPVGRSNPFAPVGE